VYLGGGGANRYSIEGGVGQEGDGNTQRAASGIATLALATGYNFQIGHAVFGIENDLNLMRRIGPSNSSYISLGSPALAAGVYNATADSGNRLSTSVLSRNSGAVARTGFEVGLGSEYAFSARFVGRVEYLYAGYGSVDERYTLPADGAVIPVRNHVNGYTGVVRAGVAYRF
jgi:opacity protein-like surface antigen